MQAEKVGVGAVKQAVVIPKVKKNPEAETSFLPDRDREMQEEALRRQIETEYELREQVSLLIVSKASSSNSLRDTACHKQGIDSHACL